MRLAQGVLILACLIGVVTGPWASSVAEAQPVSPGVTREGTIVSINREASSFVMSMPNSTPREVTVLAQKFTEISVARQGAFVPASFASLAVGDHVVVHMLMLASGQAVAVTTHVVSRAPTRATTGSVPATAAGRPTRTGSAGATSSKSGTSSTSSTSGAPSRAGSSGSGSSTGGGVSVSATGSGSSVGNGASVDASGRGSAAGNGASAGASGRGSAGGAGVSAGANGGGLSAGVDVSAGSGGVSAGANIR